LEAGKSALKLTTASYHRPSGKNIHRFPKAKESDEWGVSPDSGFDVKWTNEDMEKYRNYRGERDVLQKSGPPKTDYKDTQLAKGLEYLQQELAKAKTADKPDADADKKADKPADAEKAKADAKVDKSGAAAIDWPIRSLLTFLHAAEPPGRG
jgi:carboxyl-terminal processing protease